MTNKSSNKAPGGFKEFMRKRVVALKRKPQTIPLLVLAVAFLVYSLNLTQISDTTARINKTGMGLAGFATMLFSLLSFVCFLRSFPHRKKPNTLMLVLLFLMLGIIVFCDYFYAGKINEALKSTTDPLVINDSNRYIERAAGMLTAHRIILIIGAALTALVPVIGKFLKKIDTSLPVDDVKDMDEIDISGEN